MDRRSVLAVLTSALAGCGTARKRTPERTQTAAPVFSVDPTVEESAGAYEITADVSYPDSDAVVADLALEVTNTGNDPIGIESGAPSPFGVLIAEATDGEHALPLWSERYETSDGVRTDGYRIELIPAVSTTSSLEAGESVSVNYSLRRDATIGGPVADITRGEYVLTGANGPPFSVDGDQADIRLQIR